jgi:parallel beta-helix repeat protein
VLDGEGLVGSTGIRVAPPTTAGRVDGFRLSGLTIRNYRLFGVFLIRVDNYSISDGVYQNNLLYGIYPVRSTNGLVEGNHASGSVDSGIYIGQSDLVVIRNNICFDNTTGIEIENATRIEATTNLVRNNSVGISAFVLPGLSIPKTEDILLQKNTIINNNRPNTVTDPNEIISRLPAGSGILIVGADRVEVRNNRVINNDSTGVAVIRLPAGLATLDPRVNPFPDNNLITGNTVLQNGKSPDPRLGPLPPADFDWDLTGAGNHWENNRYQTSFPSVLP